MRRRLREADGGGHVAVVVGPVRDVLAGQLHPLGPRLLGPAHHAHQRHQRRLELHVHRRRADQRVQHGVRPRHEQPLAGLGRGERPQVHVARTCQSSRLRALHLIQHAEPSKASAPWVMAGGVRQRRVVRRTGG
jgi:hypothetical protein